MHQAVAAIAPGSICLWELYDDNEQVPVPDAHRLVLLAASPGTKSIHAHAYMASAYCVLTVIGSNNQRAFYRLYKEEARALAPEERLALIGQIKCIGEQTSVGVFRKALGI